MNVARCQTAFCRFPGPRKPGVNSCDGLEILVLGPVGKRAYHFWYELLQALNSNTATVYTLPLEPLFPPAILLSPCHQRHSSSLSALAQPTSHIPWLGQDVLPSIYSADPGVGHPGWRERERKKAGGGAHYPSTLVQGNWVEPNQHIQAFLFSWGRNSGKGVLKEISRSG